MSLIAARPSGGSEASLSAIASTSASSASSSTAFQIRPHSAAFSAGSGSPVSARPSARAWPTRRGSTQVPPLSGIRPIAEKLWMNLADFAATTMSQASAILAPAPAATPLTRAITGWGSDVSVRISGFQHCSTVSPRSTASPGATARSLRSCPAQKPRPAPVSTTTRASPRLVERVAQLLVHLHGEAVEPVGAVERDPGDRAVALKSMVS